MGLPPYDPYPASPGAIREAAAQARTNAGKLSEVLGRAQKEHRAAVDVTAGDIVGSMSSAPNGSINYATAVNRKAIWTAAQVEAFADAVEVYNRDSEDPWSIERLNKWVGVGAGTYFCLSPPGPDASAEEIGEYRNLFQEKERELKSILDAHYARLRENLDASAREIATALSKDPSDEDIVAMWKAGNLPAYAALAWPHLNLRRIPIDGIDENLFDLSKEQLFARLRNPDDALSDAELEWLMLNYPEQMAEFRANWTIDNTVLLPPGQKPANYDGPTGHGLILGPDGRWYPVEIPTSPAPQTSGPTVGPAFGSLHSEAGGWVTVDHRQGNLYVGEEPPTGLLILSGITGFVPTIYGAQSVGENQTDYLTYDEYGGVHTHQQAADRPPAWSPPPSIPEPADPAGSGNPRLDRLDRTTSIADMAIGGLKGLQLSNQIDANNSYAGNVVFQENGDGRRAVIQLAQLTYDQDSGKVIGQPWRGYGVINEDGEIDHARR